MKNITILSAALAVLTASVASAQLVYTNEGVSSWGTALRASAHDQAIFNTLGSQTTFSLNALASAGTFTDISGTVFPDEFAVGSNHVFPVFAEISFAFREAVDHDLLVSAGPTTLFDSSNPAGLLNTIRVDGTGFTTSPANWLTLTYSDTSLGFTSGINDLAGVKVFLATGDANYNYYAVGNEDRKETLDADFNDFDFVVRVNKTAVGFVPVPEPSTYGLIGGAVLLGLAFVRRFRKVAA